MCVCWCGRCVVVCVWVSPCEWSSDQGVCVCVCPPVSGVLIRVCVCVSPCEWSSDRGGWVCGVVWVALCAVSFGVVVCVGVCGGVCVCVPVSGVLIRVSVV